MYAGMSDREIAAIPCYRLALRECWRRSGKPLYLVAEAIGLLESHLSRILAANEGDNRTLGDDYRLPFMMFCGNFIPWRWQVLDMQSVVPSVSVVTSDGSLPGLAADLQILARKISDMVINGYGYSVDTAARFSLSLANGIPDQIVSEAFSILQGRFPCQFLN